MGTVRQGMPGTIEDVEVVYEETLWIHPQDDARKALGNFHGCITGILIDNSFTTTTTINTILPKILLPSPTRTQEKSAKTKLRSCYDGKLVGMVYCVECGYVKCE